MSDLLSCVELGANDASHAVIWLHGLGADGHDFEPIVPELKLPPACSIRFIFPHAPQRAVTINAGVVMRAWYDIRSMQIEQLEDETGIRESERQVQALIARENARGIASEKIVLAGFSQGGAIALHTGLRYPQPLAGIIGLSTYLPLVDRVGAERSPVNQQTPILLAHGMYDPIVPFHLAEDTHYFLQQYDYGVELHRYPMQHSVCGEEIDLISAWLQARLC